MPRKVEGSDGESAAAETAAGTPTRREKPAAVDDTFVPGDVIAERYRVTRMIAHGGMGDVYEVNDQELRTAVALKTIRGAATETTVERFRRELYLARKITHPNVCRMFDLGRHTLRDGREAWFITMELLGGETLSQRIKRGKLSTSEALPILRQICAAVGAAHAAGVVHRDLKPGNVMLLPGTDAEPVRAIVTDFGVAHGAGDPFEEAVSGTGDVVGSPAYMAPEQLEGAAATPRADIYALGIMLYEMVTGVRPFTGESSLSAVIKRLKSDPPPPREHAPDLDPRWEAVILRCLARDPARRFATTADVTRALADGDRRPRTRLIAIALTAVAAVAVAALVVSRLRGGAESPPALAPASTGPSQPAPVVAATAPAPLTIAVLPFEDLSQAKDQEYFSDGLSEDLLVMLSKLPQLRVAGKTSSFSFKHRSDDAMTIGHKLHVSSLLVGTVRKAGDQLRINARLVNTSDGFQVWAETYDRQMTDVFAVQDEIAKAVVAALKVKLLPAQTSGRGKHGTANPNAYTQLLLARQLYNHKSGENYTSASAAYRRAIELDPTYAAAYAGLAVSEYYVSDYTTDPAKQVELQRGALAAAEKAVALDPELAEAYAARGYLRTAFTLDWSGAEADTMRALELDPSDATVVRRSAQLFAALGRLPAAVTAGRTATELDPLSSPAWNTYGVMLTATRQFDLAAAALARSLEIDPGSSYAHFNLGVVNLVQGKLDEATRLFKDAGPGFQQAGTAMVEHDKKHPRESQVVLDELIRTDAQVAAYQIAEAFAWRGDLDQAFTWLERAVAQHDGGLVQITYDPLLAKVRHDPRYAKVLDHLRLPH